MPDRKSNAEGGSYIRQADGSLTLVSRTEMAAPIASAMNETTTAAPKKTAATKETDNG